LHAACSIKTTLLIISVHPNIAGEMFEKIYEGEPIFDVFSVFGEDLQYRCFSKLHHMSTVSQSDIDAVFASNYCIQIIETGFAGQF
jgi:hypothetical protein